MRFFSQYLLTTSAILSQTVFSLPSPSLQQEATGYDYGNGDVPEKLHERQSPGPYITTGVKTNPAGSPLPLRMEMREMQKNTILWNLYLLGLDYVQRNKSQSHIESWYQLSGIHGRPFIPYDSVQPTSGAEQSGYCEHISVLFLPWHRPYLALYEQILYAAVQYIAQQYPVGVRAQYVAAAVNFRIPYWDWAAIPAAGQSVLPSSAISPTVNVNGPRGIQSIWNPLYSYQFQSLNPSDIPDAPFDIWPSTLRFPTSTTSTAASQDNLVQAQLAQNATSIRNRLYTLLTRSFTFTTFSNEGWYNLAPLPNTYDSIESLHDTIHSLTGGGGHMTWIQYSAFDPLFWVHHAMIDRCWQMWQLLHPTTYVLPQAAHYDSYTMRAGSIQDINTPLTPFYKDAAGAFWTAAEVRSTDTFGYAYAETRGNSAADVLSAMARLYGPNAVPLSN